MLIMIIKSTSPYPMIFFGLKVSGLTINKAKPWTIIYCIFQIILCSAFGILGVLEIILGSDNLKELILSLSAVSIFIQTYVKLFTVLLNEKEVRDFVDRLAKYRLLLLEDNDNKNLIFAADYLSKKYVLMFTSALLAFPALSLISNFIIAYLSNFEKTPLIHQLWIPWKTNVLRGYLAGTFLIFILSTSLITVYLAVAALQFTFSFQMSAYLKILQNKLKTKGPKDKMIYYHHGIIIKLIQDFNKLFSTQMYAEILVGSLEPCGFGYAMIKALKNYDLGVFDLFYKIFLILTGSFIICSCGQEISSEVDNLHISAYMNNWYEEKPKIRRDLNTMLAVTVRPLSINYRLFTTFDYKCFAVVIQGVYSYLMMVSSLETKD